MRSPAHPLPLSRKSATRRAPALGFLGALLLSACLSDGPNQVGGDYLERHDIVLETPVHKVTLARFPVDSFWTEDLSPDRVGDTSLLLGVKDGFSAQARIVFNLSDTALLDSLEADNSLKLSLGFYRFPNTPGARAQLESTLQGATRLRVLVESWVVKDVGLGSDARAESLAVRSRRFLVRQDTSVLIPGTPVLDTLVLRLDGAYAAGSPDSLQANALARLRDTLLTDAGAQWLVQMQLTPLPDSADTGSSALVRLGGYPGKDHPFAPCLLFGAVSSSLDAATGKQRLFPHLVLTNAGTRSGSNYKLRHTGGPAALLIGKNQGLHLRLDRDALLDSLESAFTAQGLAFRRDATGEFDLGYFVPFAHIRLPIDTSWAEQDVNLQFRLFTDLDSLLPAPDPRAASRVVVPFDTASTTVAVVRNSSSQRIDTVKVAYSAPPQDAGLRRVIIRSSRSSTNADTVYLRIGETRPIIPSVVSGSADRLVLTVAADSSAATVDIHLNTKSHEEENLLRDPATGERITDLNRRVPGFFAVGEDDSLPLRATRTFQRLLNRARLGDDIASDLFVQPAQSPAYDPVTKVRLPYPVVGEIRPAIDSAGLDIGVTIYLYPLKDR